MTPRSAIAAVAARLTRRPAITAIVGGAAAAAVLVVAVFAATAAAAPAPAGTAAATPSATAPATPHPLFAGGYQDPAEGSASRPLTTAVPTRLRNPAIGVDSGLEQLGVDGTGALQPPVDFDSAGWFAGGVVPGDVGPAIIAGHVDSITDAAVFYRIGELAPGDEVDVDLSDGTTVVFTVTGSEQSPKSQFPTSDVYSTVPRPELRLITCAGVFDRSIGHYTDNLIVFAALRS